MKRILLVICLLLVGVVAVGASGVHRKEVSGALVGAFPLQNGDAAIVTLVNGYEIQFSYISLEGQSADERATLMYRETPDSISAVACGQHVHVVVSWAEFEQTWHYAWRLPVDIEQSFLPLVCR